jgi:hypothetical protein
MAESRLLDDLLIVLGNRWGWPAVRQHLDVLEQQEMHQNRSKHSVKRPRRASRASAYDYVQKKGQPSDKIGVILELAARFDEKRFLPTIADVRRFLGLRNFDWKAVVKRESAVPKIFDELLKMPSEQLDSVLRDGNYGGPSRLGPLSEAIKDSNAVRVAKKWFVETE